MNWLKMVKAKKFVYASPYKGFPEKSNVKIVEEELPNLKDGEFLAEAVFLSVDPYMRAYSPQYEIGQTLMGGQIAIIRESRNSDFPVGGYCFGGFGWRTHTVSSGHTNDQMIPAYVLPDLKDLSPSLGLGILGMTGNTAYFGFLEICQPKSGETVVVSAAAGAVGSHVGQIAKIKGCKVIGIAGSNDKAKWLTEELGFEYCINYKTDDISSALKKAAPSGIDCYFDNVGGEISSLVLSQMNDFGKISVCGSISTYNEVNIPKASVVQYSVVSKQLKMEGFIVTRWLNRWMEGIAQNMQWVLEGKIKAKETVTDGFENMFQAFTDMLRGANFGKAIVKV